MVVAERKELNIIKLYSSLVNEMQIIKAKPKKWGNSLGIVLPKDIVKQEQWTTDEEVILMVMPKNYGTVERLAGIIKTDKTAQQLKDEIREDGYDNDW